MIIKLAGLAVAGLVLLAGIGWYLSPQDELKGADAIVAISGDDGARLDTAIALYNEGWAKNLIFAGAASDPKSPSNALVMQDIAVKNGVPASAIEIEEVSKNTQENADFTAKIIKEKGYGRIILVTSPYHQRRASIEFNRALSGQVEIINYSAVDASWRRSRWWITPRGWYLTVSETPKVMYSLVKTAIN